MRLSQVALLSLAVVIIPLAAHAAPICPALTGASSAYYAADTPATSNCNTIITIDVNGQLSFAPVNLKPYDGNDDNYVGVINNYIEPIAAIILRGKTDIFGFDGDGIDHFGIASNALDTSSGGYGGADAYFTAIHAGGTIGTVNFLTRIASGGTAYFSLENPPSTGDGIAGDVLVVTPEPSSLILLGTGVLSVAGAVRRRFRL